MEIIESNKEYIENKFQKKAVKIQRKICPCCGRKRSRIEKFFLDFPLNYNERICSHHMAHFKYFKCRCKKCHSIWTTDSYCYLTTLY